MLRTPEEIAKYLTVDQLKLYTLIWKRAVASQMSDAVYDMTTLLIDADDYQLRATGSILRFQGFLALNSKLSDEEKDTTVPYIEVGKELVLHKLLPAEQHFTEPPAHFTEATLIKELEEKGIGRPSTYAPTIVTIISRGYVVKEGKKLLITDLGNQTTDMLTQYFTGLIDIPFSATMEADLDMIAEEKANWVEVLRKFYTPFMRDVKRFEEECPALPPAPPEVSDVKCEKCGAMMVIKEGRFGKFLACPNFPNCRNAKPIVKKMGVACPHCGGEVIERKTKTGKLFYGCERYPECDFTTWDLPLKETCLQCGSMLVEHTERNGRKRKFCSNPECKNARPVRAAAASKQEATLSAASKTTRTTRAGKTTKK